MNVKSFIQRRGRARAKDSWIVTMTPYDDTNCIKDLEMFYDQEVLMNLSSKNKNASINSSFTSSQKDDDNNNTCKTIPEILEAYLEYENNRIKKFNPNPNPYTNKDTSGKDSNNNNNAFEISSSSITASNISRNGISSMDMSTKTMVYIPSTYDNDDNDEEEEEEKRMGNGFDLVMRKVAVTPQGARLDVLSSVSVLNEFCAVSR